MRGGSRCVTHFRRGFDSGGSGDSESSSPGIPDRAGAINIDGDGAVGSVPARIKSEMESRPVRAIGGPVNEADYRPPVDMNIGSGHVVINSIDDFIAMHLKVVLVALFFDLNRRHILKFILVKLHLKYDEVSAFGDLLDYANEIDFAVVIKVEIVDSDFRIVESFFKRFKIC